MKNNLYICSPKTKGTGCSSVRLEYSSGGRVVAGSNPVTPTDSNAKVSALRQRLFCCPHVFCSRAFPYAYFSARLSVLADTGFRDACFSLGTGSGACARGEFAAVPGGAVRPGAMRVGRLASECRRSERGAGHCYSRGDIVSPVRVYELVRCRSGRNCSRSGVRWLEEFVSMRVTRKRVPDPLPGHNGRSLVACCL